MLADRSAMADIVWPNTLPQNGLLDGTTEQLADTTVRFAPDTGPAQVRRRFTAGVRQIPFRIYLTPAQYSALVEFHTDTTAGGSLPFDWVHPITGSTVTFRFVGAPSLTMLTPRSGADPRVLASFTLELLPTVADPETLLAARIWQLDLTLQRPPTPEDLAEFDRDSNPFTEASGTNFVEPGAAGSGPDGYGDPDVPVGGGGVIDPIGGGGVGCKGCNGFGS
jgi:hypothetical protein